MNWMRIVNSFDGGPYVEASILPAVYLPDFKQEFAGGDQAFMRSGNGVSLVCGIGFETSSPAIKLFARIFACVITGTHAGDRIDGRVDETEGTWSGGGDFAFTWVPLEIEGGTFSFADSDLRLGGLSAGDLWSFSLHVEAAWDPGSASAGSSLKPGPGSAGALRLS